MTITRTYYCDLCNDLHQWQDEDFIGIYWESNRKLIEKPAREVEHHLCFNCIKQIIELWEKHD